SEVGRAGVILDEREQVKKIIFHPRMMPSIVFLDPQLTVALPANVTAATGMDALAHCLEAYCAPGLHPMADGIAAEGVRLVREWLAEAVRDGGNLDARGGMLMAAMMGATAFQKGLGAMHALSHPIGALYKTHHGLTNAVLMPYVLQFNRTAIDGRLARLAGFAGLPRASFDALLDWVLELRHELLIPHSLGEIGVTEDKLDQLALMAEADPSAAGNPLPFGATEARRLLDRAMSGELAA
ncbi:MAG: iron-containing alcohol dehydrogenase, partial [Pseudomonadota bacterium]|nr:iron-containing alcohol dehydrogenase [Pseudomonadota bacterium]